MAMTEEQMLEIINRVVDEEVPKWSEELQTEYEKELQKEKETAKTEK